MCDQRIDDVVNLPFHHSVQLIDREIDPVIRQPPLRKIVGADALAAIAAAHHRLAGCGDFGALLFLFLFE